MLKILRRWSGSEFRPGGEFKPPVHENIAVAFEMFMQRDFVQRLLYCTSVICVGGIRKKKTKNCTAMRV